ncbi:MAG: hypothetical protein WAL66_02145 [Nitrososphaeraceae archaeon]
MMHNLANNNQQHPHHLTKFFLIISLFVIAISILAVYSTIVASEYGLKKDDLQTQSLTHLLKSTDWLNDYEEQKLGGIMLQAEIDNMNITYNNLSTSDVTHQKANYYLHKYRSYIDTLHANKSVEGSLANLRSKVEVENSAYEKSLGNISETSKIITTYEIVTILLIVGAGLGGISEIAKNKMIGYPGFVIGGVGVIILLLFLFTGATV